MSGSFWTNTQVTQTVLTSNTPMIGRVSYVPPFLGGFVTPTSASPWMNDFADKPPLKEDKVTDYKEEELTLLRRENIRLGDENERLRREAQQASTYTTKDGKETFQVDPRLATLINEERKELEAEKRETERLRGKIVVLEQERDGFHCDYRIVRGKLRAIEDAAEEFFRAHPGDWDDDGKQVDLQGFVPWLLQEELKERNRADKFKALAKKRKKKLAALNAVLVEKNESLADLHHKLDEAQEESWERSAKRAKVERFVRKSITGSLFVAAFCTFAGLTGYFLSRATQAGLIKFDTLTPEQQEKK